MEGLLRDNDRLSTALTQKKEKGKEGAGGRKGNACETATEGVCMCQESVVL